MEDSPWGASDDAPSWDHAPLPSLMSARLASPPRSPTRPSSSSGWGDDSTADGGWGGAVDDYTPSFAPHDPEVVEDVETDEVQLGGEEVAPHSLGNNGRTGGVESGWGPEEQVMGMRAEETFTNLSLGDDDSAPLPAPDELDFAPVDVTLGRPTSPSEVRKESPKMGQQEEDEEDDWGGHGQDALPPIEYKSAADISTSPTRTRGWGEDEEWTPTEIPAPLPSMGALFKQEERRRPSADEGEGWGGEIASYIPPRRGSDPVDQHLDAADEAPYESNGRGKSIPAALVDGLKDDSRTFANTNWSVQPDSWSTEQSNDVPQAVLSEPPAPSPSSPITNSTPLSSLFRQTPTLYPNFRDGLDKTALKAAETLKGTGSTAYRNAKFGSFGRKREGPPALENGTASSWDVQSGLGTPDLLSEQRGRPGDEYDVDGPGGIATTSKLSSWWGAGSSTATSTTNMPKSLLVKKDDPVTSEAKPATPPPTSQEAVGKLGRLFGRFGGRKASPSPRTSEDEQGRDWNGESLAYLEDAPASKTAPAKADPADVDAHFGAIFGDPSAPKASSSSMFSSAAPQGPGLTQSGRYDDDFGGLMGSFAEAPKGSSSRPKTKRVVDPFDPFGDDDDDDLGNNAPLAPSATPPIRADSSYSRTASPFSTDFEPYSSRGPSPLPPAIPQSASASFPALAAPQARGVSSIAIHQPEAEQEDSFDSFFSSMEASTSRAAPPTLRTTIPISSSSSSPSSASSSRISSPPASTTRINIKPRMASSSSAQLAPPRASTLSPPPARSATASPSLIPPPPRTGSASSGFFAPPPPPIQPVQRGFGIAPPPPAASPVGGGEKVALPVTAAAVSMPPPPKVVPAPGKGGPLSMDDLSFFESL